MVEFSKGRLERYHQIHTHVPIVRFNWQKIKSTIELGCSGFSNTILGFFFIYRVGNLKNVVPKINFYNHLVADLCELYQNSS
ncbi:hypothetical protein Lser_V15G26396 [Lactuca serriola]